MPVMSYLVATFAGTIPRALILASVGAFAGDLYARYESAIDRAENAVLIGAGILLVLGLLWLRSRKKV
jgi:LPXTG-motif cell wall-anchored protein